jgi:hypothetical protein
MVRRKKGRLYRDGAQDAEMREFERRYGVEHGDVVYGETVGKVARERAAANGGEIRERIKGHMSISSKGTPFEVRPHFSEVHAHPHGRGHHGGRCAPGCARASVAHRHRRGRGSSRHG